MFSENMSIGICIIFILEMISLLINEKNCDIVIEYYILKKWKKLIK